jgi:hypothetical protein
MRHALVVASAAIVVGSCAPQEQPGPFEQVEDAAWRVVNRSHKGQDGIFVQATLRTFAYEIASMYARAESEELDQQQLESRFKQFVHMFIDARYPDGDGTDINNLFFQYLIYVNPSFDASNPLQRQMFDNWRGEYVRRLMGLVYDSKYPLLRHKYDERWGPTLYSRLVFNIYLDNSESEITPRISDIGSRTFLVDEDGNRYNPSGLAGPYPYEFDRPRDDLLKAKAVYRLFFPNRKADRLTPIVGAETALVELVIEGLGDEPTRRLKWDLPLEYPTLPMRRIPSGIARPPKMEETPATTTGSQ